MQFYHVTKKVAGKSARPIAGFTRDDMMSMAMVGVLVAVERFDPTKGTTLVTYAFMYSRFAIKNNTRFILDVPKYAREDAMRLELDINRVRQSIGREPTKHDLADAFKMSIADVEKMLAFHEKCRASRSPLSDFSEEHVAAMDFPSCVDPELESGATDDELQRAGEILGSISSRDFDVLRRRFVKGETLDAIGSQLRISRERVRQIIVRYTTQFRSKTLRHQDARR
jgi:RNA polymerase sigma factor (sigma-70 family)